MHLHFPTVPEDGLLCGRCGKLTLALKQLVKQGEDYPTMTSLCQWTVDYFWVIMEVKMCPHSFHTKDKECINQWNVFL